MQIVSDRAADLAPEQLVDMDIHFVPLRIELEGKSYLSGIDLQPNDFYQLLSKTDSFPTTSQPSAGDFAELYRSLAQKDPDILSVHVSSGLSGTIDSARAAAQMVPEANVTIIDSLTLSCPLGWQVEAAARGIAAGWSIKSITKRLQDIGRQSTGVFTLPVLKYLIHGGRISHMRGLVASKLNIKPIISVDKITGKYISIGQEVTFKRAINKMAELVTNSYPEGTPLRIQLLHGNNLEGLAILRARLEQLFKCTFLPTTPIAPVLGAHTGPGIVGMSFGPASLWSESFSAV
jgi:DegV family protein with EDD domain